MRVAIDISPTNSGHKARGIGSYTRNLIDEFKKGEWDINFEFFGNPSSPPLADIIHHPYFDLFFHTLPINKKGKRIVTIHDVIPLVFPDHFPSGVKGKINLALQKLALKNVDAVICDSQASKKDIVQKLSYPKEKIHVVYLAPGENFKKIVNRTKLSRVASKYSLPSEFVLYVGDVNWNKNILGLLDAVKIVGAHLVMVGQALINENLDQVKEISAKIKSLGFQNRITRTGFVSENDLNAIYNLAKVTILPSFYEGFGLPLLESMACGTPVVCSNVASLSEIAADVAIICNPSDPPNIAQKINYVLNLSQKQKNSLSQKCIQHAARFSCQKVAQETVKVYKNTVNAPIKILNY